MIWRFRTGSQRREMPERFGAWQTVYNRFMRWRDAGVFQPLLDEAIARPLGTRSTCPWSVWTPLPRGPITTPPACGSANRLGHAREGDLEKGERRRDEAGRTAKAIRSAPNADASADDGELG
jgi:hypothetical protein